MPSNDKKTDGKVSLLSSELSMHMFNADFGYNAWVIDQR